VTDHKRNEDTREELGITDINTAIKTYQKKWLEHLERTPENRILNMFYQYKPNGRRCQEKIKGKVIPVP